MANTASALINVFESKLKEYLKSYYFIGGMPEAVDNYIKNRDLNWENEV